LLTEASGGSETLRRQTSTMTVRRGRAALAGEGAAGGLEVSGMRGSVGEAPAEVTRGLRKAGTQRRRAIEAAEQITGGGVEARFR
jgi:hypothetical protein